MKRDGTITTMRYKSVGNAGAYADHTMFALKYAPKEITEVALAHIPNVRFESYGVYTNKLPACMMRGVGNSQFNLIFGLMIDLAAERLGVDPIDFCVKNFGHEWESLPDKSLARVLEEGSRRIDWKEKRHVPGQGPVFEGTKKRGVGFSCHPAWHAEWQEVRRGKVQVAITLNPDCTVMLKAPSVETGNGSNTCNVLGCAQALGFLGLDVEDIHWSSTVDSDEGIKDCVQTDSAVSYLQSELMAHAARELKDRIREIAAPVLGRAPGELEIGGGRVFVSASPGEGHDGQGAPLVGRPRANHGVHEPPAPRREDGRALFRQLRRSRSGHEHRQDRDPQARRRQRLRHGHVRLGRRGAAGRRPMHRHGRGPRPRRSIYDKATGVPLNFNWIDYHIPTMADMPDIEPVLLEVWKGGGEYGACGIGEGTVTCTPRAILNAVYNAIGARIDEIPATPEKVLRALGKA